MNPRKVLFIDVDQTIYDNKNKILYPSTEKILKDIYENNKVDMFLATGRTLSTMGHLTKVLKYFKGFVTNNGQTVSIGDKIVYENPVSKELIRKVENYANQNDIAISYVGDFKTDTNFLTEKSKIAFHNFQIHNVHSLNKLPFDNSYTVKQFWIFGYTEKIEQMKKDLKDIELISWPGNFGSDGLIPGTSKVDGIKKVIELFEYDPLNTYAIGDGDNDIKMFKAVNKSVCMGNGTNAAKAAATYVTDDIKEDGFKKGLEYILNEKNA